MVKLYVDQTIINKSARLLEEKKWDGHLYWFQNEETIFPLATEAGKTIRCSVPAKLISQHNESLSKNLKVAFWHGLQIKWSVYHEHHYQKALENQLAWDQAVTVDTIHTMFQTTWRCGELKLEESPKTEFFLNTLKDIRFAGLVIDHAKDEFCMIIQWSLHEKIIRAYSPVNKARFSTWVHLMMFDYFVVNYDLLHHKPIFSDEVIDMILEAGKEGKSEYEIIATIYPVIYTEADMRIESSKEGKSEDEIKTELYAVIHTPDILKRKLLLSIFSENMEEEHIH